MINKVLVNPLGHTHSAAPNLTMSNTRRFYSSRKTANLL